MKSFRAPLLIGWAFLCFLMLGCIKVPPLKDGLYDYASAVHPADALLTPPDIALEVDPNAKSPILNTTTVDANLNVKGFSDAYHHWILVDENAPELWQNVLSFLDQNNITIKNKDPEAGYIQSDWLDNLADTPSSLQRSIRISLGSIFPARHFDRYIIRIEAKGANQSAVHLSHSALMRKDVKDENQKKGFYWDMAPRKPELEAAILSDLAQYLIGSTDSADPVLDFEVKAPLSEPPIERSFIVYSQPQEVKQWLILALDRLNIKVIESQQDEASPLAQQKVRIQVPNIEQLANPPSKLKRFLKKMPEQPEYFDWTIMLTDIDQGTKISLSESESNTDPGTQADAFIIALQRQLQ